MIELRNAATDANPSRLKDLIEAGADVNYLDVFGQTALSPLIYKFFDERISRDDVEKYIQCLDILLSSGANPNLGSPEPFAFAAELRNRKVLNILINAGANVNAVFMPGGITPLHLTLLPLEDGQIIDDGCAIDLIRAGANLTVRDSSGLLPMHLASKNGLLPELQEILNRRPQDIEEVDNEGLTSIMLAAIGGYEEAVKVLLSFGAKSSDNLQETLLAALQDKQDLERRRSEEDAQISDLSDDDARYLKWAGVLNHPSDILQMPLAPDALWPHSFYEPSHKEEHSEQQRRPMDSLTGAGSFSTQRLEAMKRVGEMLQRKMQNCQPQDSASETLDLTNLPFDPALKAMEQDETEEQATKAESIRRLKVRQVSKALRGQTQG